MINMNEWKPTYKAKLENIVNDSVLVSAVSLTDACMLMCLQPQPYKYMSTVENAGQKNMGKYVFKKVDCNAMEETTILY